MSNSRRFRRILSRKSQQKNSTDASILSDFVEKYIQNAINGRDHQAIMGNFFLFSSSGDAWLLHCEDKLCIQIAAQYERKPFQLVEDEHKLKIGWEHYFWVDECFTTSPVDDETKISLHPNYPTKRIKEYCPCE